MLKFAWLSFWSVWFCSACEVVGVLVQLGYPAWFVNALGPLLGTGYAWRMCRLVADNPIFPSGVLRP